MATFHKWTHTTRFDLLPVFDSLLSFFFFQRFTSFDVHKFRDPTSFRLVTTERSHVHNGTEQPVQLRTKYSADNLFLFGHLRITYFHLYPRAGRFFHQSARDAQFLQGVLVNLGVTWRPRSSDFFQKKSSAAKNSPVSRMRPNS